MKRQIEVWIWLLLGQFLSLLICGTGIFSTLLVQDGIDIPVLQSIALYASLAATFTPPRLLRRGWRCLVPWYVYVPVSLADVLGNYLVVKAYQYTDLMSIMLLDCLTIPFVVLFSTVFLKTRYSWSHLLVILYIIAGAVLLVLSSYAADAAGTAPQRRWLGDLLCVASSFCYAVSNVAQERLVKTFSPLEFLSMIGIFGCSFSAVILAAVERSELQNSSSGGGSSNAGRWMPQDGAYYVGFTVCMFLLYSLTPILLARKSAAFFNLNLLTADGFSLLAAMFLFGQEMGPLFWVAFCVIISGLAVYNMIREPRAAGGGILQRFGPASIGSASTYRAMQETSPGPSDGPGDASFPSGLSRSGAAAAEEATTAKAKRADRDGERDPLCLSSSSS